MSNILSSVVLINVFNAHTVSKSFANYIQIIVLA